MAQQKQPPEQRVVYEMPFRLEPSKAQPGAWVIMDATGRPLAAAALAEPQDDSFNTLTSVLSLAAVGLTSQTLAQKVRLYGSYALMYRLSEVFNTTDITPRLGCPALLDFVLKGKDGWAEHYGPDLPSPSEDLRKDLEVLYQDAGGWWFMLPDGSMEFRPAAPPDPAPAPGAPH